MTRFSRDAGLTAWVKPRREGVVAVELQGELDLSTAPVLEDAFFEAESLEPRQIVLDLADLSFADAAGLRPIVAALRRARSDGWRVVGVNPTVPVRRLFELTGVDRALELIESEPSGIRGGGARQRGERLSGRGGGGAADVAGPEREG